MTAMRLPAAGGLWRTQSYHPWMEPRSGGMLASLKVGLSEGGDERLSRSYAYNSFGDITALTEGTTSYTFNYDGLGRLTEAYGRTYSYDAANRLTSFNGQVYNYYDSGPYHAVDRIGDFDRFDYDANGNMVKRNKGLSDQQTLVWDAENRLSQVRDNNGDLVEQYWYDVDGARVKKTRGSTTTYTFFAQYEEEVTNGVTTVVSYYTFGSMRIAVRRGNTLYHLHGDHLGSTSLTTRGSTTTASRTYYAYGSERSASGDLQTDRTFTGQKRDATGLLYDNARYYDPALGTFISLSAVLTGVLANGSTARAERTEPERALSLPETLQVPFRGFQAMRTALQPVAARLSRSAALAGNPRLWRSHSCHSRRPDLRVWWRGDNAIGAEGILLWPYRLGTGWSDDFTDGAAGAAKLSVERHQWTIQRLCQRNVPCVVAGQVAAQRPYPLSKRREGKQLDFQPQQISMRAGGFYTRYLLTQLQPAQDVAGLDENQLRPGQVAFGKCSFRPLALVARIDQDRDQHGCVNDCRHVRSASRARRIWSGSTRVSATAFRSRTPCSHAAMEGRDAIRSNSQRRNSCID